MKNKTITFIITSYNYERYISDAIESVINQTYTNWKLIIVDDGSKDNSLDLINNYCKKDNRISLFQHENAINKGLAESIKLAIKKSETEWIAFVESDDKISPDYLEEKIKIIEKYDDVNFIFNDVNLIGDLSDIIEFWQSYFKLQKKQLAKIHYPAKLSELYKKSRIINFIPTFSCVMLKKELMANLDYDSPLKNSLDFYLWAQLSREAIFYYSDKKMTFWRKHKDSYINSEMDNKKIQEMSLKCNRFILGKLFFVYYIFYFLKEFRRLIFRFHCKEREIYVFNKLFKF